ncbi:MAG: PDZ domain-containing protein [Acidobacteria bacterium]|nr:PDZ domain-containing protein [Acidobacteriota bacterium]
MRSRVCRLAAIVIASLGLPLAASAQGPRSCSVSSQNLYVRDQLRDLYLWSDTLPSVDATRYASPEAYLEAVRYRPLDSRFSYITNAASSNAFYSDSQFIGFGFSNSTTDDAMMVLQVFPDSPAAEAGLARGDRIVEVNGQSVASLVASGQVAGAFGPSEDGVAAEVLVIDQSGAERRLSMTKRAVTIPTVSLTSVYDVDGRRAGYIFFRNFVRPSVAALDEAFASLHAAGVQDVILDLRYNGGGLVDVARHLGSLIGGTLTAGQPFATFSHNARNAYRNETLRFEVLDQPAPRLDRLIVITSRASASASELVINALTPFMPVVLIGDATYGKPVGQYLIEFCDKVLAPVAFSLRNANDQGDFFDGLAPTCTAADTPEFPLGDAQEGSLAEALHYVRTGACSPRADQPVTATRMRAAGAFRAVGFGSLINAQ